MVKLDYTFERQLEIERREAWKEGYALGFAESFRHSFIKHKIYKKVIKKKTLQEIAEELEEEIDNIRPIYEEVIRSKEEVQDPMLKTIQEEMVSVDEVAIKLGMQRSELKKILDKPIK